MRDAALTEKGRNLTRDADLCASPEEFARKIRKSWDLLCATTRDEMRLVQQRVPLCVDPFA
jgi:hypothetical protein